MINVRPVGVLIMEDNAGQDEKDPRRAVARADQTLRSRRNYSDLPEITMEQIQHFFEHYKDLEPGKWVKIGDWHGAEDAKQLYHGRYRARQRPEAGLQRVEEGLPGAGARRRPAGGHAPSADVVVDVAEFGHARNAERRGGVTDRRT